MIWATRLDAAADAALVPFRVRWLLDPFLWLTTLGSEVGLLGSGGATTAFLWMDHRRRALVLPLWTAFGGVEACVWSAKYLFGRARPVFLAGVPADATPSFPSAHAAVSTTVLGFVAYALARDLPAGRTRSCLGLGGALLIGLIAFSRVLLRVHFLTDVLAGLVLGGAWLLAAVALARRA